MTRAISYDEALRLNGQPGYTEQSALEQREAALADLRARRGAVRREWQVMGSEPRTCDAHGPYVATLLGLVPPPKSSMFGPRWSSCPACDAAVATEQAGDRRDSAEMRRELERQRLLAAAIPERFLGASLANYQHRIPAMDRVWRAVRAYADDLEQVVESGRSLVLCGPPGGGKSHLAVGVLRELCLRLGGSGHYATQSGVVSRLRACMSRDADETEADVYRALATVDLLVVDEVGRGIATDYERNIAFRTIDERYQRSRPTIVCTNATAQRLGDVLDAAALDRLRDRGGQVLRLDWVSQRGAKRVEADDA